MIARQRGAIVTVAAAAARMPTGGTAAYAAAKAGVVGLSRHVAGEVAAYGIRVNCVSPSVVLTETNQPPGPARAALTGQHPLGRLGEPADVTAAVLFLLSAGAGWITGVTLDVAGGRVMPA
jgi:3-oxoacyl-[acyl-carrier protein] reductase